MQTEAVGVRYFLGALAFALVVVLGGIQAVAMIAVRPIAASGAWVGFVPERFAARVDSGAGADVAMPGALRLLLAHAALRDGDDAAVAGAVERLPAGVERAELGAEVLERSGDAGGAADAYLRAGDLDGLERRIDALVDRNDVLGALGLARAAAARLSGDRAHVADFANAEWDLGRVEQLTSYLVYPGKPALQDAAMHRSLAAYEKAVALAPLSAKFLLAAGAEEQNLGALAQAQTYYQRAQAIDPASPDAYASLGEIALLRGDRAGARALLARARALDAASESATRLAQKLAK